MKPAKLSLITALVLGGLLASTGLSRAQSTNENRPPRGPRGMPSVEQQLDRMTQTLNLTDAQKPKVKAVLEETNKKRGELANVDPQERREKMRELMQAQDKKLKEILTAEQYDKWEKTRQEMRRNRPGGPGGPGGASGEKAPGSTTKE